MRLSNLTEGKIFLFPCAKASLSPMRRLIRRMGIAASGFVRMQRNHTLLAAVLCRIPVSCSNFLFYYTTCLRYCHVLERTRHSVGRFFRFFHAVSRGRPYKQGFPHPDPRTAARGVDGSFACFHQRAPMRLPKKTAQTENTLGCFPLALIPRSNIR